MTADRIMQPMATRAKQDFGPMWAAALVGVVLAGGEA
jgi:hypothetical protein